MALTGSCYLVTAGPYGPPHVTLAQLVASYHPPAFLAGAVSMNGVAAAVSGAPAGVLAQWTPASGVADALASDSMAVSMGVALTHLTAVWSPELKRTAW